MTYTALHSQIIPQNIFGALPRRSANDLVSCVVHDVEHILSLRQKAVLVTLDVQGAFDSVLHERLLRRIKKMGWPIEAISWIRSFLKERRVRVRYNQGVTDEIMLECGLPQGSPLSPILFLLYMSEVVAGSQWRFGYADDIAIMRAGKTTEEAAASAQEEVDDIIKWSRENAVSFDPTKTEVIYFLCPCARHQALPKIKVGLNEIVASDEIRWLGVFLDRRLTFRRHVAEWASAGKRLVQHLQRLASCTKGPPPGPMTIIIRTVIMPVILHAAGVWWPGLTRATIRSRVKNATGKQREIIDGVLMAGIRTAIPTWRTMPGAALRRETGIPPAHVLLEERRVLAAARMRRLDQYHPLRLRAMENTERARFRLKLRKTHRGRQGAPIIHDSRVQRAWHLLPDSEIPPPIQKPIPLISRSYLTNKTGAASEVREWLAELPNDCLCAYSDGAGSTDSQVAWSFAIYIGGDTRNMVLRNSGRLFGAEVYDAELHGAIAAIEAILSGGIDK